ncbi:DUF2332 family protein [Arthrobacter sp. Z1-15]
MSVPPTSASAPRRASPCIPESRTLRWGEFFGLVSTHVDCQHLPGFRGTRSVPPRPTRPAGALSSFLNAAIEGLVALLEVGASAGICLYPDRYSYSYQREGGQVRIDPPQAADVLLECELRGDSAVPTRIPEVIWRAGIDLNPIDITDRGNLQWLEALIWPEHEARRQRLHAAAAVVAADPPLLVAGDLDQEIARLPGWPRRRPHWSSSTAPCSCTSPARSGSSSWTR